MKSAAKAVLSRATAALREHDKAETRTGENGRAGSDCALPDSIERRVWQRYVEWLHHQRPQEPAKPHMM